MSQARASIETLAGDTGFKPSNRFWAETHEVRNLPRPLENYNVYGEDVALKQAVRRFGADWAEADLMRFGAVCGSSEVIEWGFQANANKPELFTHDRYGQRVDEVRFHPAYHQCMALSMKEGIHASHWSFPRSGAQVARAAKSYMMTQIEAGHGCPITMTSAAIPTLRRQPDLYNEWASKILHRAYDPRNVCHTEKESVTIGMAMTEKQGGSDVRQNSTRAYPLGKGGSGQLYELVGHKYFVSAPMCDAFLVLAQTESGVSCFLVPRWRPDGTKNPLQIQRLKNKMGNVSNASSETELRGALGWLVGEEGRGIPAILEMVAMTRFDCMIGSSALMRQGIAQITHHCAHREAFGKKLTAQPLMQNVLADLILENEAGLAFTMRLARALDNSDDAHERNLVRMGTAIGKYWICKRAPGHSYEAMECIGGSGVMEDSIMPRLFRESPINTIWEGSGNVQCLDMLRAMQRNPESFEAVMNELHRAQGKHPLMDNWLDLVQQEFADQSDIEYRSRRIVERLALAVQASTLLQYGEEQVAADYCAARLDPQNSGWVYGTLPRGIDCAGLIDRARPKLD
ncbi:MAG: acyl-CoA dehydrogenase family protein [Oleiphilaceae bacterium]|nr:acyl-CoA dehydrogenase family protein [Oleiphilaceae bacterium]